MDEINRKARLAGATTYRDYIVANKRLLSRHYFDKDDHKIAVFSCPTATWTVFEDQNPYLAHAGTNLSEPVSLL